MDVDDSEVEGDLDCFIPHSGTETSLSSAVVTLLARGFMRSGGCPTAARVRFGCVFVLYVFWWRTPIFAAGRTESFARELYGSRRLPHPTEEIL